MNGADLTAGAVAGLTTTRHPIAAARAVMEQSPHVMLIGEGADTFAASVGLQQVPPAFFFTERRWLGLESYLRARDLPIPDRPQGAPPAGAMAELVQPPLNERKFGNLAAGTSTGGMTGKRWGRVGDVPVLGAGTYASNRDGCAVSATGDGEYFIRATVARDICARIGAWRALSQEQQSALEVSATNAACAGTASDEICMAHMAPAHIAAANAEIAEAKALGGLGGVIVMLTGGQPVFAMSTSGMYRGSVSSTSPATVAIYADE